MALAGCGGGTTPTGDLAKISTRFQPEALQTRFKEWFAPDHLLVTAAGNVPHDRVLELVQGEFGHLKSNGALEDHEPPKTEAPLHIERKKDLEQVHLCMGVPSLPIAHGRRFGIAVLNNLLGGGMSSRLFQNIREKRGLAYSVHSNLFPFQHGAVFVGNVATKNEAVGQSLEVIENELRRLAEQGPTAEELESAKSYLTGSYALRFESSSSIANQLLWIQIEDLGIDYVNHRNELIEAVSLEDIKRVAKRLFETDRLITTIVGKPVATKTQAAPG
jgi:zinc protease